MKILITGSNGYIGKALQNHYVEHSLTLLHRGVCDLTDELQVDNFFTGKYDVIIHCAAAGGSRLKGDTPKVLNDNLKMFLNLHKHKDKFDKFIHFGSGAQYHAQDTYYGLSKKLISDIISAEDNFFNLIIYGLFDENEIPTRFIKSCVNNCMNNKNIIVHKNKQMDFFHMEDLLLLVDKYISEETSESELECVYYQIFDLCKIADIVLREFKGSTSEIVVREEGLDRPYCRKGNKYLPGNLELKILETIGKIKVANNFSD